MLKTLTIAFVFLFGSLFCFSQTPTPSPDKWGRYSVADMNVSISFPRLPVRAWDDSQNCHGELTDKYGIYSNGAVYVMAITYKINPVPLCDTPAKFSEKNFQTRLASLGENKKMQADAAADKTGLAAIKFRTKLGVVKLYNDPKNDRWIELEVVGADESKPEAAMFLKSLAIEKKPKGIDIGPGWNGVTPASLEIAPRVPTKTGSAGNNISGSDGIGDRPDGKRSDEPGAGGGIGTLGAGTGRGSGGGSGGGTSARTEAGPNSSPLIVVLKPRPQYTEEARQIAISGTVRLRVNFNANGRIGSITIVSGLGWGLTETAIAAARKLVYVPPKKDGIFYSISKVVEYNFNLY